MRNITAIHTFPGARPRTWLTVALACAISAIFLIRVAPASASTEFPCPTTGNPIPCENALAPDLPSEYVPGQPDNQSIEGYATSMGVDVGSTESFKIDTASTSYHIDILRLGWYGGAGARLITVIQPSVTLPQTQPACIDQATTGLIDCGNWAVSASWAVPTNAVSGVYVAYLVDNNTGAASSIEFVVRNDASTSDILVQTSDATWEAYNSYGGNSLYICSIDCPPGSPGGYKGASEVSYNRPFLITGTDLEGDDEPYGADEKEVFWAEYPMIQFLEREGYNVSYTNESEVEQDPALLLNHKIFMSSGHDEYWSAGQRSAVQAAINAGVNVAFFSGNEMFWKTRWANSIDGTNTPYRTLVTYKETHYDAVVDPDDPPTWTGTWRDPRFSPPADGGQPENAVTGQLGLVDYGTADITVPYQYSKLRLWRNTAIASLKSGQTQTLAPGAGTLGFEWDVDADNGFRPAGEFDMSSTTVSGVNAFYNDYGTTEKQNTTATHNLTEYRAPSGALVFGAGTVDWAWGLDSWNGNGTNPDPNMEQATVNLLADMGNVQPATLESGLVAATESTDTTPPKSTISSPIGGSTYADGSQVTITGSATDSGGGVVAGVAVSTDGGVTWHPATLTTADNTTVSWSYTWIAHGYPSTKIESRAVDDSGNIETPSDAESINITCPCSLWGTNVTPTTIQPGEADSGDGNSIEVGVQFDSSIEGLITGLRFYKASTNVGTHIGNLWTASGQLLASATFTGETASGWQQVNFATPVDISPNTTYVASYFAPDGHYSSSQGYFYGPPSVGVGGASLNASPLHAIPDTVNVDNGLYSYSATSTFPTNSSDATNYWVDPIWTPLPVPGQVTGVTASALYDGAAVSWTAPTSGGPVKSYTVTPYIGSTAQTSLATSVTGATNVDLSNLTAGTTYTFAVTAVNDAGSGPASSQSNAITATGPSAPSAPQTVTASPATAQALVSWSAPATTNGGGAITGYTVTPYAGTTAGTPVTASATATSADVTGLANGTAYTFQVKATNGIGTGPSAASSAVTPNDTLFDFTGTPTNIDSGDASSTELGVKFEPTTGGTVTGIRFYKASTNTGTHVGSLWSSTGTLLASGTFTNETASGWQTLIFSSPVSVTANTLYVAAYFAPNGHYSSSPNAFNAAVVNGPLDGVATGTSANGVYSYTSSSAFPSSSYEATNYWVDVLFAPTPPAAPGQVTAVTATAGSLSASVSWTAPATGGAPSSYTVTPYVGSTAQTSLATIVPATSTSTTITGLTAGTSYTFVVQASNSTGAGPASAASNAVIPTAASAPSAPQSVTASPASSQALVNWAAPSSNGGSAVTGYTITPYAGTTAGTAVSAGASATSATITGLTNGTAYTFQVKAINNTGTGAAGTSAAVTPEDTILDFTGTPTQTDTGDTTSVELGLAFEATTTGSVTGIRFYKASTNTGTHVGSLWTASGTLLASGTFTNETASGWQTLLFSSPVAISANTIYVAGYLAPNGHYSASQNGFSTAVINGPLEAVANATSPNGVYAYSGTSTFPTNSYAATNYWVDVLFAPTPASAPGQVTGVTATAGALSAAVSWTAPTTGGAPTSYTVTPYIGSTAQTALASTVSGSTTSTTVTGLTAGTAYTFVVQASNATGAGTASAASNAVTPTASGTPSAPQSVSASPATSQALVRWTAPASNGSSAITGYTITPYTGTTAGTAVSAGASATSADITGLTNGTAYTFQVKASNSTGASAAATTSAVTPEDTILDFTGTPIQTDSGDTTSVELGVAFESSVAGSVTGIRFYKASTNTGTHVGSLWSSTGTLLASGTFTNETASGWQTLVFSSPVAITANTIYVAGYLAPNGHYSASQNGFSAAVINGPLTAVASGTTANGVYTYATTSTFPTSSYNATNYWVDVLFAPTPAAAPGQVTGVTATAGALSAAVSWTAPTTGGAPTSYTVTPYIGSTAQTALASTVSGSTTSTTVTGLTAGTAYTFVVQASNATGAGTASAASNAVIPTAASTPSAPQGVSASPATSQALVSWTAPASNGGSAITGYTITPYAGTTAGTAVSAGASATSADITGLTNGTAYTFQVKASNSSGAGAVATTSAVTPQDTILDFTGTPIQTDSGDTSAVEVGVKFEASEAGHVTGIRFYKATTNTGTHVGSLWSSTGTLLGSGTFTNETASGWQTLVFSSPVAITANTIYVAGYFAPNGHYSASQNGFNAAVINGPLTAVATGVSPNGVYAYSATSTFPSSSYNATNYWVDVLFTSP